MYGSVSRRPEIIDEIMHRYRQTDMEMEAEIGKSRVVGL